jgi:hypothetical protein
MSWGFSGVTFPYNSGETIGCSERPVSMIKIGNPVNENGFL